MRELTYSDLSLILQGLQYTVLLTIAALAFGGPVSMLLALARISKSRLLNGLVGLYVYIVQGIPLLALLMFTYFGLPVFFDIDIPAWASVVVAFTIYTSAYMGEIWAGALRAIPVAQWEAARCLGITPLQQLRHVILPQALKLALPTTVGFLVQLIKGTSLAAVVGFVELTRAAQLTAAATLQALTVYALIACVYFAICFPLSIMSRKLEVSINAAH